MRVLVCIVLAALPVVFAMGFDKDLSCAAHIPVIGTTAVCVALCDALFGQIVSNTRWIPFSGCYTPAEAQAMVKKFRSYHMQLFGAWMIAKVSSSIAIAISGAMIIKALPKCIETCRMYIIGVGYLTLGISLAMALYFVFTYFHAVDASDEARLKEMNYTYIKDHAELCKADQDAISRELNGFAKGFISKPKTAIRVRRDKS